MTLRTRLALPIIAVLLAATTAACGSDDAPEAAPETAAASEKDFCEAQGSLLSDLSVEDLNPGELPDPADLVEKIHAWADKVEKVGTPEDMSETARAGFEATIEQARELTADDLSEENLNDLGEELSGKAKEEAEAFNTYVGEKCGNLLNDIEGEMPELPETPDATE